VKERENNGETGQKQAANKGKTAMENVLNGRLKGSANRAERAVKRPANKRSGHLRQVEKWGTRYVVAACVLSSGLNAWANVDMCGSDSVLACGAAAGLGAVVPGLVWMLGHVAGHAYRAGRRYLACAVGAAGVALLVLSIWHCAHAIALLTGGGIALSGLLAVGIDYGLIASEVAAVMATQE
jgi:hypothetical protein